MMIHWAWTPGAFALGFILGAVWTNWLTFRAFARGLGW